MPSNGPPRQTPAAAAACVVRWNEIAAAMAPRPCAGLRLHPIVQPHEPYPCALAQPQMHRRSHELSTKAQTVEPRRYPQGEESSSAFGCGHAPVFAIHVMPGLFHLTAKVLLQPFQRKRATASRPPRLSAATAVRLGPATCQPLGTTPGAGPKRKLRSTGHLSKTVGSPTRAPNRLNDQSRTGTAPERKLGPEPRARGLRRLTQHCSSSAPPDRTTCSHQQVFVFSASWLGSA